MGKTSELNNTDELLQMLFKEDRLDRFLQTGESNFFVPTFSEYISDLCVRLGEIPEHIIQRANIEKSYGHQIFVGRRNPSRDTVIQFAFGFQMNTEDAQKLLRIARKSTLYPRVKRDSTILYCLHNKISLPDTQIILHDLELPLLGEGGSK